ncbi:MAG: methyltransferase [Planctomycetota bacterium]|nr:MAG: methyltransferase [Planctomycetota bacterium]
MSPRFLPLKIFVANSLSCPFVGRLIARVYGDKIPHRGCIFDTKNEAVTPSVKASLFWGLYENAELRFVRRFLRPDLDVVELGSSLGVLSSHIARKLDPSRRMLCLEANPLLIESIRVNLARNAPQIRATVVHAALDYSTEGQGGVEFAVDRNSLHSKTSDRPGLTGAVCVPAVTLSRLLSDNGVGEYALVSDIEGAEAGMVCNEKEALARCRQMIIELHSVNCAGTYISIEAMSEALQKDHGFVLRDHYGAVFVFERP